METDVDASVDFMNILLVKAMTMSHLANMFG